VLIPRHTEINHAETDVLLTESFNGQLSMVDFISLVFYLTTNIIGSCS